MENSTLAGLSALTGAGLYGAGRLVHNVLDGAESKPKTYGGASADKIVIRLPSSHTKKKEETEHDTSKTAMDAFTVPVAAAALAAGYYGTNKLHDKLKKDKAEADLNEVTTKYHGMLDKIKGTEKTSSDTPIVDAMCRELLAKKASVFWPDSFSQVPVAGNLYDWAKQEAGDGVVKPILGIGATIAAGKFLADRVKRKREEEAGRSQRLPTQIVIEQPKEAVV